MTSLRDEWEELRSSSVAGGGAGFRLRMLDSRSAVRLFAAVSEPGLNAAMVIELPETACPRMRSQLCSRAFNTTVGLFPGFVEGHVGIAVQLREPSYEDLFGALCEDIAQAVRVSRSPTEAGRGVVRSIERWRRFLERHHRKLTDEQVRGLIGELVVLARTIIRYGGRTAVLAWTGPDNALRDFELPDASVEVKTYQSSTGASIRINDPQQLDDVASRPVYVAAIQLAESESRGCNLAECIDCLSLLVQTDPDLVEQLQDKLASSGYLPAHREEYPQKYAIEKVSLYAVTAGFPRIRIADVPPSVTDVHFSIMLNALNEFSIAPAVIIGQPSPSLEMMNNNA